MSKPLTAYQKYMKRELKGKMKGKTKAQRKAIFSRVAKAWKGKGSRGNSSKGRSGSSSKTRSTKRSISSTSGGVRKVGKKGFNTQKIFSLVRLGALGLPAADILMSGQTTETKVARLKKDYFGVDANGDFNFTYLLKGWGPYVAANVVTYGIPKLNKMIRSLF